VAPTAFPSTVAEARLAVNAIAPAPILTETIRGNPGATPDPIPVGRLGRPTEVADAAVMLAGNDPITDCTIGVNGGRRLT
jgi:3-oxoacyl-[acyl-carrier protein] reductase